jgi:acetyl-coenzyme A synthetase (EC 6.2.1.1)
MAVKWGRRGIRSSVSLRRSGGGDRRPTALCSRASKPQPRRSHERRVHPVRPAGKAPVSTTGEFAAQARIGADALAKLQRAAEDDPIAYWGDLARRLLAWQTPFRRPSTTAGRRISAGSWMVA